MSGETLKKSSRPVEKMNGYGGDEMWCAGLMITSETRDEAGRG